MEGQMMEEAAHVATICRTEYRRQRVSYMPASLMKSLVNFSVSYRRNHFYILLLVENEACQLVCDCKIMHHILNEI